MLTFNRGVIFPHYPTRWARNTVYKPEKVRYFRYRSPSHAVGLEQGDTVVVSQLKVRLEEGSPSHTVGLEPVLVAKQGTRFYDLSPSHAVGLELESEAKRDVHAGIPCFVTIPPSGLRASKKQKGGVSHDWSPSHMVGLKRRTHHSP